MPKYIRETFIVRGCTRTEAKRIRQSVDTFHGIRKVKVDLKGTDAWVDVQGELWAVREFKAAWRR